MKPRKDPFAPERLDEQLAHLAGAAETGAATPEQRVLQDLHALHATRAERERRLLERVHQRLVIAGAMSQSKAEEEDVSSASFSLPKSSPIALPPFKRKRRQRLGMLLQSLAAVFCVGLLVGSFLILLSAGHRGTNTASGLTANWRLVSSPHLPSSQNYLWSVSASAANDVWAVGDSSSDDSDRQTLIEHWDGRQWRVVASPSPGFIPTLVGVTAIAPDNAWAVGTSGTQGSGMSTVLIEHWNGSQWSVVSAPNPGSGGSFLNKVIAIAANNVWAVGATIDANVDQALVEHWDGSTWRVVPSPSPPSIPAILTGVTAISANDIWAVGSSIMPSPSSRRALIEHWDGKTWSIVDAPNLQAVTSQLLSVSAVASNDVWAVGTLVTDATNRPNVKPLIEHWDGQQWSASPIPTGLENGFDGVLAINAHDVWAVESTNGMPAVLFVHWDGRRWSTVQGAQATTHCQNEVNDLAAVPHSSTLWAVGDYVTSCTGSVPTQPLLEVYTP